MWYSLDTFGPFAGVVVLNEDVLTWEKAIAACQCVGGQLATKLSTNISADTHGVWMGLYNKAERIDKHVTGIRNRLTQLQY